MLYNKLISGAILLFIIIASLVIGEYLQKIGLLEGYTDIKTQQAANLTTQIPTNIQELQDFIAQFNTTQKNIDAISTANIVILQQLVSVSVNDKTLDWTKVAGSLDAYKALQLVFNASALDNTSQEHYSPNNTSLMYHDTAENIAEQTDAYGLKGGTAYVFDSCGNKIALPPTKMQGNVTYYQPGTYRFGAATYVPSYEDSVYLSRTSGVSQVATVNNAAYVNGDLCNYYKNNPDKMEEICQNTDIHDCASKSCCVLLGGTKCVRGNSTGPTNQSNYADIFLKNKDFYYYKNKCYGNCQNTIYKKPVDEPLPLSQLQMESYDKSVNPNELQANNFSQWKTSTAV